MIDIKANGPESSSFLGVESCEDSYFREGGWIPNPYLSNKDDVDEFSEYTLLGENNILAEAQALTSLILFFRDHLKRSFSNNSVYAAQAAVLCIFAGAVIVFRCGLTSGNDKSREALSPHFTVQYAHVVNRSDSDSPGKQVPAPVKEDFVLTVSDLRAAEDIAQLLRAGFVLKGSTVITAEQAFYLGNRGGGNEALINPNDIIYYNISKGRGLPLLPKPKIIQGLKAFQNSSNVPRRVGPTSSASAVKAKTDNQSSLSFALRSIQLDSSPFINGVDSLETRNDRLSDSLVPHALEAAKENVGFNIKNLANIQKIAPNSVILTEKDKIIRRQAINLVLKKISAEHKEAIADLKRVEEEKGTREEINTKRKQVEKIKQKLIREKKRRKDHLATILNSHRVVIECCRTPGHSSQGKFALSFQVYNPDKLSEKEKEIIKNNLTSYLNDYIKDPEGETLSRAKLAENVSIIDNALEFCFDVNIIRTKKAMPVDKALESCFDVNQVRKKNITRIADAPKKSITWLAKETDCDDERYKNDDVKEKTHEVDHSLLKNKKSNPLTSSQKKEKRKMQNNVSEKRKSRGQKLQLQEASRKIKKAKPVRRDQKSKRRV